MIRALIADDEPAAIELLKARLSSFSDDIQLCSTCANVRDALRDIRLYRPELLLLDIELGDGLSFEILEQLPDLQAHIIFITAYDHYALKAIKLHAFDYILKPVVPEELDTTLRTVINRIGSLTPPPGNETLLRHLQANSADRLAVPSRNGFHYYKLSDIIYIEASGSYCQMHLASNKTATVTKKIKDFEQTLSDRGFLRVHKSFLVHLRHIAELHRDDSGYLVMSNDARIPISSKGREAILRKIREAVLII